MSFITYLNLKLNQSSEGNNQIMNRGETEFAPKFENLINQNEKFMDYFGQYIFLFYPK